MAKRKSRTSYTSKGVVGRPMRTKNHDPAKKAMYQLLAWKAGKNVVLTVPNPDKNCTKARFIRVNAREYWGSPFRKVKNENTG